MVPSRDSIIELTLASEPAVLMAASSMRVRRRAASHRPACLTQELVCPQGCPSLALSTDVGNTLMLFQPYDYASTESGSLSPSGSPLALCANSAEIWLQVIVLEDKAERLTSFSVQLRSPELSRLHQYLGRPNRSSSSTVSMSSCAANKRSCAASWLGNQAPLSSKRLSRPNPM